MQRGKPGKRAKWRLWRRCLTRCLLGVLTGCRSPAVPYTVDPPGRVASRHEILARQLAEDSARELAGRPFRGAAELLGEAAQHLEADARGLVGKCLVMPYQVPPDAAQGEPLECAAFEEEVAQLTGCAIQPGQIDLYFEGDEALACLEEMIDQATRQIDVLMFLWEDDAVGRAIAERLVRRAGPNLRVRVLIDGGGNLIFSENHERRTAAEANGVLAILARNPHIEVVRIRNPFARFDHRKLVVIDGRLAWTGGRNLTKRAFFDQHDVTLRVAGPLAGSLQRCFDESWRAQGGRTPSRVGPASAVEEGPANARARVLETAPGRQQLARALYHAVDSARHHIYLENIFFCDSQLIAKLSQARRRGVDVRVVLTFCCVTPAINRANRVVANRLLRAGIRVYVYPCMTHVKALSVDGRWAYLGTANFDTLSFRHNRELGLAVSAGPLVGEIERRLFLPDLRPECEMHEPLPVGPGDYLFEALAGLFL